MATVNSRIQLSADTETNWTTINPTLKEGEPALVKKINGYYKLVVGNIGGSKYTESVVVWDELSVEEARAAMEQYASNAKASETAAKASQTAAKTSETNAKTSETNAASSASTASSKASAASTSAANAKTSETNAKTSETNAKASETAAKASQTEAASSASSASTSATNAANSATLASDKATAASTSATNAASSETNAKNSATAAATSEKNAKTSETNAASSAQSATNAAENAATSETNAAASASAAASSASAAKTSETNAKTSETNAASSASAATTKANAASTSATNAANSASTASTKATAASTSATNAANSATAAAKSAEEAAKSAEKAAEIAGGDFLTKSDAADTYVAQTSNPVTDVTESGGTVTVTKYDGTESTFEAGDPKSIVNVTATSAKATFTAKDGTTTTFTPTTNDVLQTRTTKESYRPVLLAGVYSDYDSGITGTYYTSAIVAQPSTGNIICGTVNDVDVTALAKTSDIASNPVTDVTESGGTVTVTKYDGTESTFEAGDPKSIVSITDNTGSFTYKNKAGTSKTIFFDTALSLPITDSGTYYPILSDSTSDIASRNYKSTKLSVQPSTGNITCGTVNGVDVTALATKASPAFTGTPTAPTASAGTSTTQIATTEFVMNAINTALAAYAKLSGATFTGDISAPTVTATTSVVVPSGTVK